MSRQAYLGPDGSPRLFRPQLNMERMARSAERVALPVRIPGLLFPFIRLYSTSLAITTSHSTQMPFLPSLSVLSRSRRAGSLAREDVASTSGRRSSARDPRLASRHLDTQRSM